MTGSGHTLSGLVSSIPLTVLAFNTTLSVTATIAVASCCVVGATAPDWLEIPYSSTKRTINGKQKKVIKRVFKHRGITHIAAIWVISFFWAFLYLKDGHDPFNNIEIPQTLVAMLFGFSWGGILHLLGDLPNKQKIPIFTPLDGISFNLWKSGKMEKTTTTILFIISLCFVYFEDHIYKTLSY